MEKGMVSFELIANKLAANWFPFRNANEYCVYHWGFSVMANALS